ncbi:Casein kinase 1-like protein 3 [Gracilariopsis chorda]|uniref:non-specific serine/threonine protein kinase n=1 Tax=Gracilariopsis chorda TaxID=448386 RepID=A0A2V3ILC8_9FLOR|nr:Casein kinase 1-like protein 3 [Gracilariopsis chorda]|eukprot:PXF42869.1 Casein kinase 1-like protein 3 [Gracilariopsis chorda]
MTATHRPPARPRPRPRPRPADALAPGSLFQRNWRIAHRLGAGAFGTVYAAYDRTLKRLVALKVDHSRARNSSLLNEYIAYVHLALVTQRARQRHAFPTVHAFSASASASASVAFLAMDLMGPSVHAMMLSYAQPFTNAQIVQIGLRVIYLLSIVHHAGYVHRDVKPSNLLFPHGSANVTQLYLIDFGLAYKLLDDGANLKPPPRNSNYAGTPVYASMHVRRGHSPRPRDDLESLAYTLLHLFTNQLPWLSEHDWHRCRTIKRRMSVKRICEHLPHFQPFLRTVRSLQPHQLPPYELLMDLLKPLAHLPHHHPQQCSRRSKINTSHTTHLSPPRRQ